MTKQTTNVKETNSYHHVIEVVKDYYSKSGKELIFKAGKRFQIRAYDVHQWKKGSDAPLWYYGGQVLVPREYCRLLRLDVKRVITTDETVTETEC